MSREFKALPFNTFASVSVSGGTTFTSSVTAVQYKDNVGYQVNFSGSPQGVLQVSASNDYNPQLPQSANPQGSSANGNWITLASCSIGAVVSPVGFNLNQVPFGYVQCQLIASTSTGVLTGWVAAKGLG